MEAGEIATDSEGRSGLVAAPVGRLGCEAQQGPARRVPVVLEYGAFAMGQARDAHVRLEELSLPMTRERL